MSMCSIKVTIPATTLIKMLLRGVLDLSFINFVVKEAPSMKINERKALKTISGIVARFEKISNDEVVVLSAYIQGRENESIQKRAIALSGMLTQILEK